MLLIGCATKKFSGCKITVYNYYIYMLFVLFYMLFVLFLCHYSYICAQNLQ